MDSLCIPGLYTLPATRSRWDIRLKALWVGLVAAKLSTRRKSLLCPTSPSTDCEQLPPHRAQSILLAATVLGASLSLRQSSPSRADVSALVTDYRLLHRSRRNRQPLRLGRSHKHLRPFQRMRRNPPISPRSVTTFKEGGVVSKQP